MSTDLLDIFHANSGIVCCVGAGGKKTTMFRLAAEHSGRVGITATAHIEYFPNTLDAKIYIGDEKELLESIKGDHLSRKIAFAKPSQRFGRRAGVNKENIDEFKKAGNFDLMVIKADGARGKLMKAPAEHEPEICEITDVVIPIVSAKVFDMTLNEKIAHRVEQICCVTGLNENDIIEPVHVAKLLSAEYGSLKNTMNKKVIPLINMVEFVEQEKMALEAAKIALAMTDRFDHIVIAAMKNDNPIVDIVYRD